MRCVLPLLLVAASHLLATSTALAQDRDLDSILRFELESGDEYPPGWTGGPVETIRIDTAEVHDGRGAACIERTAKSPNEFSLMTISIPLDFKGDYIYLSGFLRTEGVARAAGLLMREDGERRGLQFVSMQRQHPVSGTTDWDEYVIMLPVDPRAKELYLGAFLMGEGKLWVDDLQIIVDGSPREQAPKRSMEPTILDLDHEFDAGSGIDVTRLTERQVDNLELLGKVWGFLKYHHPGVAAGEFHWDYELFRILPQVLDAVDDESLRTVLSGWIQELGVPDGCDPCARPPTDPYAPPPIDWIRDEAALGSRLSGQLQRIYANRFAGAEQFYVAEAINGNARLQHELEYRDQREPDAGYRILALLRLWNIVEYWYPYRDVLNRDWDEVLREFIPRFAAVDSRDGYHLAVLALLSRIQDGHAVPPDPSLLPPRGECYLPAAVRFVEDHPMVVATPDSAGSNVRLRVGDVILAIDGQPIDSLIERWSGSYSAGNRPRKLLQIATYFPRGPCQNTMVTLDRGGETLDLDIPRGATWIPTPPHDRPGDTFQLLSPEVAYLKLSSIRSDEIDDYIARAEGTEGLVVDLRNYPSDFVVFTLGSRFVERATPFVAFTNVDLANPGVPTWSRTPLAIPPDTPGYRGIVTVLVDESTISQAEYTATALGAAPNSVIVGSTTAGADGNVSTIPLPGGLQTRMSGIGVFYPDRTPTQRVGIVPDIEVRPTIAGMRAGRDEVLEAAIRRILGPEADQEMIRQMARGRSWNIARNLAAPLVAADGLDRVGARPSTRSLRVQRQPSLGPGAEAPDHVVHVGVTEGHEVTRRALTHGTSPAVHDDARVLVGRKLLLRGRYLVERDRLVGPRNITRVWSVDIDEGEVLVLEHGLKLRDDDVPVLATLHGNGLSGSLRLSRSLRLNRGLRRLRGGDVAR